MYLSSQLCFQRDPSYFYQFISCWKNHFPVRQNEKKLSYICSFLMLYKYFFSIPLMPCAIRSSSCDLVCICHQTLVFTEKIIFISNVQSILLDSNRVSEIHFPAIWRPKFQKIFPSIVNQTNSKETELIYYYL